MATWTAEDLANRVLEHMNVKATNQSVSASDYVIASEAVDSAHDRLRGLGIAPFELTAIPTWAQIPMRDYVAGDLGRAFGLGDSLKLGQRAAEHDLRKQCAIHKQEIRTKADFY
jgi:hypothetical protein